MIVSYGGTAGVLGPKGQESRRSAEVWESLPVELIAVRHGQSLTNVAFPAAEEAGLEESGVDCSDAQVPLTDLGRDQSSAVGRWLAGRAKPPEVVVSSIYLRARETADLAMEEVRRLTGQAPPVRLDERLRDRELGQLELSTQLARQRRFPDEVVRRARVGEFLYRPPAGESMADVALRVRSLLRDVTEQHAGRRVLLVCHDAVVLLLRYVIEDLPAEDVWYLGPVLNGSATRWTLGRAGLELAEFNAVDHLRPT